MKQTNDVDFRRLVFGCVWVGAVSVIAWFVGRGFFTMPLKNYETVPCRIVKSAVKMTKINRFVFTAKYSYECRGRTYISDSLKPGVSGYVFESLAYRVPLLEKYAPGTKHECRVNPENPSNAFLVVGNPVEGTRVMSDIVMPVIIGGLLVLFFSIGVFMIAFSFPKVRRLGTPRMKNLPVAGFLVLLGGLLMTVGSMTLVRHVRVWSEAKTYIPVSAKVLYSGMLSRRVGGRHPHTTYGVRVGYEYVVNGKKYENDRFSVSEHSSSNARHYRNVASRYQKDDVVTAYVSPDDPRKSLLEKSGGLGDLGKIIMMGLFGTVGLAIMIAGLWMLFSPSRGTDAETSSFGRRTLKRSYGDLVAAGFFAVIWNAFSWSIALIFAGEEEFKQLSLNLIIVAIFPVVGIFLLGIFLYKLVRELRAPSLALALSCAEWKPGSSAEIDWSLDHPEEIESIEIILEGSRMEGSGKRRYMTIVSSQSCCRQVHPMIAAAGSFGFTVPGTQVPACKWAFDVRLKVKDVGRAFAFTYPLPTPIRPATSSSVEAMETE